MLQTENLIFNNHFGQQRGRRTPHKPRTLLRISYSYHIEQHMVGHPSAIGREDCRSL